MFSFPCPKYLQDANRLWGNSVIDYSGVGSLYLDRYVSYVFFVIMRVMNVVGGEPLQPVLDVDGLPLFGVRN